MASDPNRRPFQRGSFVDQLRKVPGVHIRRRNVYETYFRQRDKAGYRHDLGAQDVFLDNLGIVFLEQLAGSKEDQRYLAEVGRLLHGPWTRTRYLVLDQRPWWRVYINADHRQAATGEPRPRLRLMTDATGDVQPDLGAAGRNATLDECESAAGTVMGAWPGRPVDFFDPVRTEDAPLTVDPHEVRPHGIILPDHLTGTVKEVCLLPIVHATPDLPARAGVTRNDRRLYGTVLEGRDQGFLPTCASFAIVFALEVAARRAGLGRPRLSPAWLHLASGAPREGRSLGEMVDCLLRRGLPCREEVLPYGRLERSPEMRFEDIGDAVRQDQSRINTSFGTPDIVRVAHDDISLLKTLIAAGWVLLIATRITKEFQANATAMTYGVPLLPLPGHAATGAHAWCVVGYDHVDGALGWKYQGRFVVLNSWGRQCHRLAPHGAGTLSLPFSFVYQEGFEAFAVRFPRP